MAISNVPIINGPSYGGVIYGLSLQMGYSSEPSKLTLDIVSKDGNYSTPTLNREVSVSFNDFVFHGHVWSYEFKETAEEKVLQVVLVDKSIILDRYSVVLWKRGLFNQKGSAFQQNKTFNFDGEKIFVAIQQGTKIRIQPKALPPTIVKRPIRYFRKMIGNIICIGTEKFPSSICDIPDTDYSFEELRSVIRSIVPGANFPSPSNYRNTHEGTLREVLQNWAADSGVDFYWDFASNSIKVYPPQNGISISTSINSPNLIEKNTSSSLEGTWAQVAYAYTTKTKTPIEQAELSHSISYIVNIYPLPISWFVRRNSVLQDFGVTEDPDEDEYSREEILWGGRTQEKFLEAAFLNYVSPVLRDIYVSLSAGEEEDSKTPWWALGITRVKSSDKNSSKNLSTLEREIIISYLQKFAVNDFEQLNKIDPGLLNFNLFLGINNESNNDLWKQAEKDILGSYGAYYRHNILNGTYFFCDSKIVIQAEFTAVPESTEYEEDSKEFEGKRLYRRDGKFSHAENKAQELLGLNTDVINENIDKIKIRIYDLESTGLKKLFPQTQATHLFITPKKKLVDKYLKELSIDIRRGINPSEITIEKILAAQGKSNDSSQFNCKKFDDTVKNSQCPEALSEAREKAMEQVQPKSKDVNLVDGLVNASAKKAKIKILGKELELYAPSDAPYSVVCTLNVSMKYIKNEEFETIFFNDSGSSSFANNVARLDVIKDNVTDPLEDNFGKKRNGPFPLAKSISNTSPTRRARYVFAGLPPPGISLKPSSGLTNIDISYSSDGFKTTVEYTSKPPKRIKVDTFRRQVESQLNRSAFNAV